jgi:Aspartokinases
MKVAKFGGSSVADADQFKKLKNYSKRQNTSSRSSKCRW